MAVHRGASRSGPVRVPARAVPLPVPVDGRLLLGRQADTQHCHQGGNVVLPRPPHAAAAHVAVPRLRELRVARPGAVAIGGQARALGWPDLVRARDDRALAEALQHGSTAVGREAVDRVLKSPFPSALPYLSGPHHAAAKNRSVSGTEGRSADMEDQVTGPSRSLRARARPTFAHGRPSTSTTSAVKSLEPRRSDDPTP